MTKKSAPPETPIRILKIGTCSTLSGRSQLTYHIATNSDGDIQIRVVQNSGNGQFNADWVPLPLIKKLLSESPAGNLMTSAVMRPVYRGRSSNSAAFTFAVLKAEGLVKAGEEKDSGYLLGDMEAFHQSMSALIAAETNLSVTPDAPPEPPKKKRPAKESA